MPVRVAVSERVQPSSFFPLLLISTYSHICEPTRMESTHSVCVYRLAFFNRFFYIRLRVLDVRPLPLCTLMCTSGINSYRLRRLLLLFFFFLFIE